MNRFFLFFFFLWTGISNALQKIWMISAQICSPIQKWKYTLLDIGWCEILNHLQVHTCLLLKKNKINMLMRTNLKRWLFLFLLNDFFFLKYILSYHTTRGHLFNRPGWLEPNSGFFAFLQELYVDVVHLKVEFPILRLFGPN